MPTPTLTSLFIGFKDTFKKGFDSAENVDDHKKVALVVPSNTREEIYQWLGEVPRMRKWAGPRIVKQLGDHEYRIKNEDFEVTVEVKKNDVDDNQMTGTIFQMEDMGISAAEWPNELVFEVLKNGAALEGYDKEPLFSATHPVGDGVVSNVATGAEEPWYVIDNSRRIMPVIFQLRQKANLVRLDRPQDDPMFWEKRALYGADTRGAAAPGMWQLAYKSTLALNAANFEAVRAAMKGIKNDEGRSMGVRPRLLVTTPANEAAARALLKAELLVNGGSNTNYNNVDLLITELVEP